MLSFDQHCQAMFPAVALWPRVLMNPGAECMPSEDEDLTACID
jgi:hypothetical protein